MKTSPLKIVLAATALATFLGCKPAPPAADIGDRQFIVGLSPFLSSDAKEEAFRAIVRFVLDDQPNGSTLSVYDAFRMRTVTRFDIPKTRAFQSARTRTVQLGERIVELKRFLAAEHDQPVVDELDFADAVRLPQFADFIAKTAPNDETVALILGSPLYRDDREPAFSMVGGYFPSDGHLTSPRERSVYSVVDRSASLPNVRFHFGWFKDPWETDVHRERVERFWTLFLENQGARLSSFSGDLATVVAAFTGQDSARQQSPRYTLDRVRSKPEMLRIHRDIGVADWITRDIGTDAARGPALTHSGPMKIGIRWSGDIDIDLYARPGDEKETLFFEHTRSPEGHYFRDHRSSPEHEFEFIEFKSDIDAFAVQARVNFYEGEVDEPIEGEARVEFEGRLFSAPFRIEASGGNRGRTGSTESAHWTRIDIPSILGLKAQRLLTRTDPVPTRGTD
jgi:hypothetical protein